MDKAGGDEIDNVSGYLFRALKFQIFKYLRDRKLSLQDVTRMNLVDVSMGVDSAMEYDELEAVINGLIDQLPDRCKQIFILSRLKNKSNKEIAAELDISIQAVKNQISKALGILRAHLKKEEFLYSNFLPLFHCYFSVDMYPFGLLGTIIGTYNCFNNLTNKMGAVKLHFFSYA